MIYMIHITIIKNKVTDNRFKVGHHTSFRVYGIDYCIGGFIPYIEFRNGTLLFWIYSFIILYCDC
jgi:hypothetical protein